MTETYIRRAHHSGSWYSSKANELNRSLEGFLSKASTEAHSHDGDLRGIIAPHAGYSYSGPTAAYAYRALSKAIEQGWRGTIVVLHPSHHVYLQNCAISNAHTIETPVGNLNVNSKLRDEMLSISTHGFSLMDQNIDEDEHSGEMQYPFIAKVLLDYQMLGQSQITILPVMVGSLTTKSEETYGKILAPLLSRDDIFTVISSDFCHWGSRFRYTPTTASGYSKSGGEIHEFIEWLDRLGMDKISSQEPGAFARYIQEYSNTICGRHPIAVYLSALKYMTQDANQTYKIEFVKYAQSSKVKKTSDSSVSYASAVVIRA